MEQLIEYTCQLLAGFDNFKNWFQYIIPQPIASQFILFVKSQDDCYISNVKCRCNKPTIHLHLIISFNITVESFRKRYNRRLQQYGKQKRISAKRIKNRSHLLSLIAYLQSRDSSCGGQHSHFFYPVCFESKKDKQRFFNQVSKFYPEVEDERIQDYKEMLEKIQKRRMFYYCQINKDDPKGAKYREEYKRLQSDSQGEASTSHSKNV